MIAVVDDDVCFAEETQELLYLSGFSSVVVVTHPHESSLALLDKADLLILDLGLAATTALGVLDELRLRGGDPAVVIVSGSGPEALGHVRSTAAARGFRVLGALPKPVSPADLLDLLGPFQAAPAIGCLPPQVNDVLAADALGALEGRLTLRQCDTLAYAGSYGTAERAAPIESDGVALVAQLAERRRLLLAEGRDGLIIDRLADTLFLSSSQRRAMCHEATCPRGLRDGLAFELGPRIHAEPLQHAARMVELRLAGFDLALRRPLDDLPNPVELVELPISHFVIDARRDALTAQSPVQAERLSQILHLLDRRDIVPICLIRASAEEVALAARFAIPLIAVDSGVARTTD